MVAMTTGWGAIVMNSAGFKVFDFGGSYGFDLLIKIRSSTQGEVLYGAVTTGGLWWFWRLDRGAKVITEDTSFYRVPDELNQISGILAGVFQGDI
jgi:hypothetical protein